MDNFSRIRNSIRHISSILFIYSSICFAGESIPISKDSAIAICKEDMISRNVSPDKYNMTITQSLITYDSLKSRVIFNRNKYELLKKRKKNFYGKTFYEIYVTSKKPSLDDFIIYYIEAFTGKVLYIFGILLPLQKIMMLKNIHGMVNQ